MGEFKINIGMSTSDIMKNINNLKNSTKTTRQNIINFCKQDVDGKVTNTIEYTMLNAWISGSEKIPMPQKPVEQGYKYIDDKYVNSQNDTFYQKTRSQNTNDNLFIYETKDGYCDTLADSDNDGYADNRQVNDSYIKNPWVQRFDYNLNGNFDRYNKIYDR